MNFACPNCKSIVDLFSPPKRGPANDGSDAWVCLKCDQIICEVCYHVHTAKSHPELLKKIEKKKTKWMR